MTDITAGPDDDSREPTDYSPDAPDPDDDPDDDPPPRRAPQRRQPDESQPSYDDLRSENERLRNATRRNNQELAKRRQVQTWMESHGIDDLDSWLTSLGVDRETGQPSTRPPTPPAKLDETEVERRVQLEIERHQAQADDRQAEWESERDALHEFVKQIAVGPALAKLKFSGGDPSRALKVMDLNSIKVSRDEDGIVTIEGLDDAVESLRTEIPEWFGRVNGDRRPPRSGGDDVDGGRKRPPAPARPTWEQQAIQRLTGQRPG